MFSEKKFLDEVMKHLDENFYKIFSRFRVEKVTYPADFYKRMNWGDEEARNFFYHHSSRPAKETVLAMAIAFQLTLEEANDFLQRAGYCLSCYDKRDVIVSYFLENGIYDIHLLNEALFYYGEEELGLHDKVRKVLVK